MATKTRVPRPDDMPRVRYVQTRSFGLDDPQVIDSWFERVGVEQCRVHEVDGVVQAAALRVPMGTYFGGRAVPTLGFAGVGVAPEARGDGVGGAMMKDALREARGEGFALASLFPSTRKFYRGLGFELAGECFDISLDLHRMPDGHADAKVVRFGPEHRAAVQALYTEVHRGRNGALARGPYIWSRVEAPRSRRTDGYLFFEGGRLVGYCFVSLPTGEFFYDVRLEDWCAATPSGLDALFRFLRGYRSIASKVKYAGAAQDAILARLPPRIADVRLFEVHLLRVLDVRAALEVRGFPRHVDTAISIAVTEDPIFEENVGTFGLVVREGRAEVTRRPGKSAPAQTSILGLASLYAGYFEPEALVRMGWMAADDRALATLTQLFGGPRPYIDTPY